MTATLASALDAAYDKAAAGERLSVEDAVLLLGKGDLLTLGSLAKAARERHNPGRVVTYIVDRNVNYTNVCVTYCSFCAFYRPPGHEEGYVQTFEQVAARLEELRAQDGRQVLLQGGHHPDLPIGWYEGMLRSIKARFPEINIHGFSPPEITHFAEIWKLPVAEIVARFKAAGLRSIPGGGGEILVDRVRKIIAPMKATSDEWLAVMGEAHRQGLTSSATMMYGHVETLAERVEHMDRIRRQQDETKGFTAFICWSYQNPNTNLLRKVKDPAGAHDYLRTVAVARLFLDNVRHVQSSWVTQGPKIGQLALEFGCDDMGGTMMEENVVSAAGTTFQLPPDEMERTIRDAGYEPRRRTTFYEVLPPVTVPGARP
ncbi:MAG: cyclic dehypoxanthinyl futalosine synthase [Planctomycetota bacterium]